MKCMLAQRKIFQVCVVLVVPFQRNYRILSYPNVQVFFNLTYSSQCTFQCNIRIQDHLLHNRTRSVPSVHNCLLAVQCNGQPPGEQVAIMGLTIDLPQRNYRVVAWVLSISAIL